MRVALLLILLLGFATPVLADDVLAKDKASERGWTYRVRFERDLASARVLVTFRGWHPKRLVLSRLDALPALTIINHPRPDGRPSYRPNPARNGILPRIEKDGDSLAYTVDFRALARITAAQKHTRFVGRDLVTRAGLFLLQPAKWPDDARVNVVVVLPTGIEAAVPWARDILRSNAERLPVYTLPKHAMLPHAPIAFGRFKPQRVVIPGGDIIYATLDAPLRASDTGIRRWLAASMGAVTDLFGKPPVERTHVLVQPLVPGRGRPVVFGRASLSGGPMVHVMLSGTALDAELPGEWMTIHEMIHLGMPITTNAGRWFGEGFVSYYQEVLRARAGFITPQQAWQNLHNWMERGKRSGGKRSLAEESRLMTNRYAYHRVYWGGAALALKTDAMIRRTTDGRYSLDDVMRYLLEHSVTPGTPIEAMELMRRGDALLSAPLCSNLAKQALASRAFPDLRATYEQLGLRVVRGRVVLLPDAPATRHRDAIMRAGGRVADGR